MIKLNAPFNPEEIKKLRAGDVVSITGVIYTARDAAHKRLCELLQKGENLPINILNSGIYYVGPTPAKPGQVIGSAGPTSSYRMDAYSEPLLKKGLSVMIGKGPRSSDFCEYLKKYNAVYMSSIGGCAASIAETVKSCEPVAYEELGAEAIYRLCVEEFYAVVTYDAYGGDLFTKGRAEYENKGKTL